MAMYPSGSTREYDYWSGTFTHGVHYLEQHSSSIENIRQPLFDRIIRLSAELLSISKVLRDFLEAASWLSPAEVDRLGRHGHRPEDVEIAKMIRSLTLDCNRYSVVVTRIWHAMETRSTRSQRSLIVDIQAPSSSSSSSDGSSDFRHNGVESDTSDTSSSTANGSPLGLRSWSNSTDEYLPVVSYMSADCNSET